MQPDLNLRRQRLAARLSQMVTAKPLGQLIKAGVVASFVTLARHTFTLSSSIYIYIYIYIDRNGEELNIEKID